MTRLFQLRGYVLAVALCFAQHRDGFGFRIEQTQLGLDSSSNIFKASGPVNVMKN